ncbi:hypothetical protein TSUD_193900 [Trifolium subterraneum]|uniref:DNA mismatch repair protein MSH2 n=1 Tax=Trifolium subterraneum TaxID=3900 RepID=A0A2Z6MA98_TRISU|nr:hypothetical protein TSUD_193900 [Trifolium subterraneum]
MFETVARDLLLERTDHTLEVYEGSGSNWRLVKSGTPGNIGSFEDVLFANSEMQDSPVVVALSLNLRESGCTIGLGFVDLTKRLLGMAEFLDDSHFTNVESALVALGCKECLVPIERGKSIEYKMLCDVLTKCGVMLTERKKSEFKTRDLVQDLGRLVKGSIEAVQDLVSGFEFAPGALGALLSYADLLADESNYENYTLRRCNLDSYMRLDSAAMRALNVLESKTDANKNFSLFGLMNRTCTAGMGKRLLHMWLKQPLVDSSIRLPYIKSALERYDGQFSSMMKSRYLKDLELWTGADRLNKFIELVETAVDLDHLESGEYMISSSYDSALTELKEKQELLDSQIHDLHRQTAVDLDLAVDKALKLDKGTQFGHVFRITKKEEPKIRKKLNTQFIVLETRKDGVKFTNTKLKKLGDKYQQIIEEYKSCQKQLVFESLAELISELDVLLSFADLASSCPTPYTRPDITSSDEGDIILEGSRHPCVEAQDWVNFIPNDWPNMGGKSTFIRQVGVNILMAQVGCFVPCDKASISVRDCIFARVGAGDCQLRGVSTFMQEMLETASILKGATDKSLIIIDELGRGTSTYDGFGLAWAICEHIVDVMKAPTLFATHFHELTALAHENDPHKQIVGVANYHVSAHIDASTRKLTMLYKVEPGACDQSFGIHVAEFANFPESVVALAREKAAELEDFSSSAISLIDSSTEEVGSKRKRAFEPDEISKGAAKARQILESFVALPLDTMDKTQALQEVKKLKDNLEKDAQNCHWLQKFL